MIGALVVVVQVALVALAVYGVVLTVLNRPPDAWTKRAVGVAVALRPPFLTGGPLPHWAILLPLGTAALYAVYQILTRKLASIDDPRTTILHTGIAAALGEKISRDVIVEQAEITAEAKQQG